MAGDTIKIANFNPRSREGSDSYLTKHESHHPISIHAPARGATPFAFSLVPVILISIHAPARGATVTAACMIAVTSFQSTLPRGERRIACCNLLRSFYFNPRSREGSDTGWNTHSSADSIFQSTLPRGERHSTYILLLSKNTISIHAPARGATNLISASIHFDKISIHAPARGATFTKI